MANDNGKQAKFLSELVMLRRVRREGWRLAGIDQPESVADHVLLVSQLAFIIGEMEGLDSQRCAAIALFHDNGETRIGDVHKVANRYLQHRQGDQQAALEQLANLPPAIAEKIEQLQQEWTDRQTAEARVAKDADLLEMAIQGKIYQERGYNTAEWISHAQREIQTLSGQELLREVLNSKDFTNGWYEGLKKLDE